MESFQILLPEKFDFVQPERWQKVASLIQASIRPHFKKQVNTLIYSMGEEAEGILYLFGLSDDNRKYNTV